MVVVGLAVGLGVSQLGGHHTAAAASWSGGQRIDTADGLTSVSCASADFCAAADSGGNAFTYSGGKWSAPHRLSSNGLSWVSCPTAGFCVATSNGSVLYTYSGGKWSPPTELFGDNGTPAHLTSVSCATATFCMATGNMHAYKYSGGTWARGVLVESSNKLVSISCPSATFCAVVDSAGNAYTYSGSSWSAPRRLGSTAMTGVVPDGQLLHGHKHGHPVRVSGSRWSPSGPLTTADGGPVHLTSVSCATASSCAATGNADGYAYSNGSWARGVVVHHSNKLTRFRARRPTSASPPTRAATLIPTQRPNPPGAATLRFPLFTFRLRSTAFALFDEHQGPVARVTGMKCVRRQTMAGSFKKGAIPPDPRVVTDRSLEDCIYVCSLALGLFAAPGIIDRESKVKAWPMYANGPDPLVRRLAIAS